MENTALLKTFVQTSSLPSTLLPSFGKKCHVTVVLLVLRLAGFLVLQIHYTISHMESFCKSSQHCLHHQLRSFCVHLNIWESFLGFFLFGNTGTENDFPSWSTGRCNWATPYALSDRVKKKVWFHTLILSNCKHWDFCT